MQHKTLRELQGSKPGDTAPYPTAMVKVNVVKVGHTATFTNSSGEKGQIINFSVTEAMVATLSDESKFNQIREGRSLTIRNFLVKGSRLVLSKQSKIMAGQAVPVPPTLAAKGITVIMPPSPTKSLKEVLQAPIKSLLTVQGEVIKDEAIKTVQVSQVETKVRTLTIQDNETQVELTLWTELANQTITIGDYIEVTHCIVAEWQRRKTLNSTRNTAIKKTQPRERQVIGEVQAISFGDTTCEVCLLEDAVYRDYVVDISMIRAQLQRFGDVSQYTNQQMEDVIVQKLPFPVKLTAIGMTVQSIEL
ncbi:uncharacterized protein LOC133179999 [Saccostrea echinata]|uniref:uncharacterized protein LOC133179999 n=1 Tax=Saccostrea echinata TaxID=191078 RepID=UPI002A80B0BE|nr:uncharacterized protein LOC133179999 [Saccostrea echinata]